MDENLKLQGDSVRIIEFNESYVEESADLFIHVFSKPPWNDIFESRETVIDFFKSFYDLPVFKGYLLISKENKVIGLSIGFIKPWLKNGCLRYEYFLDQFCIDSGLQGKGLGQFFMEGIENNLRHNDVNDIILNTGLTSPAFYFYQKIGFSSMEEYGFMSKEL